MTDFSKLSDEELQAIIEGRDDARVASAPPKDFAASLIRPGASPTTRVADPIITRAELVEPNPVLRGLAAAGGELQEPVLGAIEKFQLAFPGEGEAGQRTIREVGNDRSSRRQALRELKETPAGEFGSFIGQAAPQFLTRGTITPLSQAGIAGLTGFLGGGPDRPGGIGSELATSAARGGVDAATAGIMTKGAQLLGQTLNAAAGKYSPEGGKLLEADAAARRLGLTGDKSLSIGQLDPLSAAGNIERNLPGYQQRLQGQADTLRQNLSSTRQVPTTTGVGTEEQVVPGGRLAEELKNAVRERYAQARDKYNAVDQFAQQNGLPPITPIYSVPQLLGLQKKAVNGDEASLLAATMINHYDPKALEWIGSRLAAGQNAQQIKAGGISMTDYHDMRVAVNKALSGLDRVPAANKTSTQIAAQRQLLDLKTGLDNEAEQWAKNSLKTREAMDMYNNAKQFYSDVVAPAVISNPLARKATSMQKGFKTADEMYGALTSPANQELIDRLLPTMEGVGVDVITATRGAPDIARALAGRQVGGSGAGGLAKLAEAALGNPGTAVMELAPGLGWLSRTGMAKRIYSGANPLEGKVAGPLSIVGSQYAQEPLEKRVRKTLSLK